MTRYPSCFREEYNVKGEPTLLSKITATQYAVIKSNKFVVNNGLPRIQESPFLNIPEAIITTELRTL